VYLQADAQFRANPEDIGNLYVRSDQNQMIPLSNLVKITPITGRKQLLNLFRSIELNGAQAEGSSSGQAIKTMERLAAEVLPPSMAMNGALPRRARVWRCTDNFWSGNCLRLSGFGWYENYVDPFIILLTVPWLFSGHCWRSQCAASQRCLWSGWSSDADWSR